MNFPKELVAASATPIILALLQGHDSYGYAIIRKVREISDNKISWTDGMLYPVLHRLESSNLIQSYWDASENGRRRKYYRITKDGKEELSLLKSQWAIIQQALLKLDQEQKREGTHV
jgi:DNA-binding PadR family transcriptional regulator